MTTRVTNKSTKTIFTLPYPYRGVLKPGQAAVVDGSVADFEAAAGGTAQLSGWVTLSATTDAANASFSRVAEASGGGVWEPCRLATAAALPAYTRTGNDIEYDVAGAPAAIDGVAPAVGDRILLKDGAAGADNGPYDVITLGAAGVNHLMRRTPDADTSAEMESGSVVRVSEGTVNADTSWMLTTNAPITLNTTALTFAAAMAEDSLRAAAAALTTDLDVNSQKITSLGTPTAATDAATKGYVDTGICGDGSDGALTFDAVGTGSPVAGATHGGGGVWTMARDIYATNMTVEVGVVINTASFGIFATGTLDNSGNIQCNGADAVTSTAGAAVVAGRFEAGGDGGAGSVGVGAGSAGTATANAAGAAGGAGGLGDGGNLGGAGGAAVVPPAAEGSFRHTPCSVIGQTLGITGAIPLEGGSGGGGGGCDAGGTTSGGGGGGGGVLMICAAAITNQVAAFISANGGAGADAVGANAGGGGGGGGGVVLLNYHVLTDAGIIEAMGGAGGLEAGTGVAGTVGVVGNVVQVVL
jgi:hypothetical protein